MSRFNDCLGFIIAWEGGYSDHPSDRGGATNKGVTQRVYNDWRRANGLHARPVLEISDDEVEAIYRANYWRVAHCDDCPTPVDLALFDAAVNCGPKQAVKFLQRALGIPADGAFGPVTKHSLETCSYPPQEIAQRLVDERRLFYTKLIDIDHSQEAFRRGWNRRCDALYEECSA